MILPITLTAAGVAAIINLWLAVRCGQVRTREKISVGDGGNEALIRRMRAHANFIESAPFVLILVALVEMSLGTSLWLWAVAGIYAIGRIAHAFGMDGNGSARIGGTLISMLTLLGLGLCAIAIPYLTPGKISATVTDDASTIEIVPVG